MSYHSNGNLRFVKGCLEESKRPIKKAKNCVSRSLKWSKTGLVKSSSSVRHHFPVPVQKGTRAGQYLGCQTLLINLMRCAQALQEITSHWQLLSLGVGLCPASRTLHFLVLSLVWTFKAFLTSPFFSVRTLDSLTIAEKHYKTPQLNPWICIVLLAWHPY